MPDVRARILVYAGPDEPPQSIYTTPIDEQPDLKGWMPAKKNDEGEWVFDEAKDTREYRRHAWYDMMHEVHCEYVNIAVYRTYLECPNECGIGEHIIHRYKTVMPDGRTWIGTSVDECKRVIKAAYPDHEEDHDYLQDMRTQSREDGIFPSW
jgi:hypothetical protein